MAYAVCVTWIAKDGEEEAVAAALGRLLEPSRAEPGVQLYVPHRDPKDPRVFFVYEQYADEAATRPTSTPSTSSATGWATPSRVSRNAGASSTRRSTEVNPWRSEAAARETARELACVLTAVDRSAVRPASTPSSWPTRRNRGRGAWFGDLGGSRSARPSGLQRVASVGRRGVAALLDP